MSKIEKTVEISASPETVWSIIADPTYFTKLVPDLISYEVDPPGMAVVGQKAHGTGKLAGRKVEIFSEITEVVPNRRIVTRQRPGGLFKTFQGTSSLEPTTRGTHATSSLEYEPSMGYLGKVLSKVVVGRVLRKNVNASLANLKEIAELKEMPKT
jgi:carbon monoxide dehydrogenase subunit G